jgi:hypothetical protein
VDKTARIFITGITLIGLVYVSIEGYRMIDINNGNHQSLDGRLVQDKFERSQDKQEQAQRVEAGLLTYSQGDIMPPPSSRVSQYLMPSKKEYEVMLDEADQLIASEQISVIDDIQKLSTDIENSDLQLKISHKLAESRNYRSMIIQKAKSQNALRLNAE